MATGYGSGEVALTYAEGFARDVPRGQARMAHPDPLDAELAGIKADRKSMDRRIVRAVRLLADQGKWTALIRLLVLAGSYQQADIAKATGVMRSTVTRWFNGETVPQAEQVETYLSSLVRLLEAERDMNVFGRVEDMIIE